jgi:hypothetical protein
MTKNRIRVKGAEAQNRQDIFIADTPPAEVGIIADLLDKNEGFGPVNMKALTRPKNQTEPWR